MKKVADFIVDKRKFIMVFYVVLMGLSVLGMLHVNVNYDMSQYLPNDSATKLGMEKMSSEYGDISSITVMFDDLSEQEQLEIKEEIAAIPDVKSVAYFQDDETYQKENHSKYQVVVSAGTYSGEARNVLKTIRENYQDYSVSVCGAVVDNDLLIATLAGEIPVIAIIVVVIIFMILFLLCDSWIEPFLFMGCIGVAILINMGTNALLPSVSFMTFAVGALLQLGLSMDYSIMLMNRYNQEKLEDPTPETAMKKALRNAFGAITSSSVTTIVGLLVLVFMSFKIGQDMGIVLAKGVLISLICIFTILPGLVIMFDKLIMRTHKRSLNLKTNAMIKLVVKARYVLIPALVVAVGIAVIQKGGLDIGYVKTFDNEEQQHIEEVFGVDNQIVLLYDNLKNEEAIAEYIAWLEAQDEVNSVQDFSNTIGKHYTYKDLAKDMGISESEAKMLYQLYVDDQDPADYEKITLYDLICYLDEKIANNPDYAQFMTEEERKQITDARKDLEDGKKELADAEIKIADGEKELADGEAELLDGERQIAENEKLLQDSEIELAEGEAKLIDSERQIVDGEIQIAEADQQMRDSELQILDGERQIAEAEQQMADSEQQIADGERQIAEAEQQMADSEQQITDGEKQIAEAEQQMAAMEQQISDGEAQIAEAEKTLAVNEQQITAGEEALAQGETQLAEQESKISESEAQLEEKRKQMEEEGRQEEEITAELGEQEASLVYAKEQLESARQALYAQKETLTAGRAQLESAKQELETQKAALSVGRSQLEAGKEELESKKAELTEGRSQLEAGKEELKSKKAELIEGRNQLEAGKEELESKKIELVDGRNQLEAGKQELESKRAELVDGRIQLEAGKEELASGRLQLQDGWAQIADAKEQLLQGRKELEDGRQELEDGKAELEEGRELYETAMSVEKLADAMDYDLSKVEQMLQIRRMSMRDVKDLDMTLEDFITFITADVLTNETYADAITDDMKQDIEEGEQEIADNKELMVGDSYNRMMVSLALPIEGDETFAFIDKMQKKMNEMFGTEFFLVGDSSMGYEMNLGFADELNFVTILTVVAILIVVLFTFHSLLCSVILVAVIQSAVYIVTAIVAMLGISVNYIALILVQCILMGATIDYGILFISNYREIRMEKGRKEAVILSMNHSIKTIMTSSLILISCCLTVGFIMTQKIIAQTCSVIAYGALCAVILVIFILPALAYILDRYIVKNGKKEEKL